MTPGEILGAAIAILLHAVVAAVCYGAFFGRTKALFEANDTRVTRIENEQESQWSKIHANAEALERHGVLLKTKFNGAARHL